MTQEVCSSTGEYTYGCDRQKTTCIYPDELVNAIVPDDLPHTLLLPIFHPTILAYFTQFSSFGSSHITPIIRPYYSSSTDPSSVQLLSPIIPHQQSRVIFLSDSISIDYSVTPHQDTLYHINYHRPPSSVPIFVRPPSPSQPYSSSSADLISVQLLSPLIPHQ